MIDRSSRNITPPTILGAEGVSRWIKRWGLLIILVLSVAFRIPVALYLGDHVPPGQDDYSYHQLAARLAAGHGYTFDQPWYPFTPAETPTAHWSFLYTAFLAAIYALVGPHPLAARLVQALLGGVLLPWMTYRLANTVTQRRRDTDTQRRHGTSATQGHRDEDTQKGQGTRVPQGHRDTETQGTKKTRPRPRREDRRAPRHESSEAPERPEPLPITNPSPVPSTVEGSTASPEHSPEICRLSRAQSRDPSPVVHRPSSIVRPPSPVFPRPSSTVPLLAASIAAFYGYFILYAARLLTETFFIIALLWSLERAIALALRPQRSLPTAAQLGLALGIAALLRQSILPWVPVLFLWLLWQAIPDAKKFRIWNLGFRIWSLGFRIWSLGFSLSTLASRVLSLLIAALVLAACILPFTIRNVLVYDEFLLLNSNAGYAMYSAQHPIHGTSFQEYTAAPLPADLHGQGLNEAQWNRALMQRGIQFILDEPGRYALLSLSRVRDYIEFWPTPDSTLLYNIGRLTSFTLFLPFMLYGIALAVRRAQPLQSFRTLVMFSRSPTALLLLFIAFYSLMHILTWAMTRYRLPVDAVAIPFAAYAIHHLAARLISAPPQSQRQGTPRQP